MRTVEEIIDEQLGRHDVFSVQSDVVKGLMQALDAAGYVIVPKEPTEVMRRVAAEYLGFDPSEPKGLAEATRISLWHSMIRAAQTQETRQSED